MSDDTTPAFDLSRSASKRAAILGALAGNPMTIKDFGALHGMSDARTIARLRTAFTGLMEDGLVTYHRDGEGCVLRDGGPLFALVDTPDATEAVRLVAEAARNHVAAPSRPKAGGSPTWSWQDVVPAPEGTRRTTTGAASARRRA